MQTTISSCRGAARRVTHYDLRQLDQLLGVHLAVADSLVHRLPRRHVGDDLLARGDHDASRPSNALTIHSSGVLEITVVPGRRAAPLITGTRVLVAMTTTSASDTASSLDWQSTAGVCRRSSMYWQKSCRCWGSRLKTRTSSILRWDQAASAAQRAMRPVPITARVLASSEPGTWSAARPARRCARRARAGRR